MNDRIKLAEAMGWKLIEEADADYYQWTWFKPDGSSSGVAMSSKDGGLSVLPDPFTDANDDYAVLEHVRNSIDEPRFTDFRDALRDMISDEGGARQYSWRYQTGDWSRAYLKVI